jgi:hypothetical protein
VLFQQWFVHGCDYAAFAGLVLGPLGLRGGAK